MLDKSNPSTITQHFGLPTRDPGDHFCYQIGVVYNSLPASVNRTPKVNEGTGFLDESRNPFDPPDSGIEGIDMNQEMALVSINKLSLHILICAKSLHNQLQSVFSSRSKDNHIISKAEVINLRPSCFHIETMVLGIPM